MTFALLLGLAALALVDGTSVGTLGIPVWLALQSSVRVRSILVYLASIAAFYWLVGLVLYAGAVRLLSSLLERTEGDARLWVQLVVGVGLLALSFKVDPIGGRKRDRTAGSTTDAAPPSRGRIDRLKARVTGEGFGGRTAVVVAIVAATIELATMLPYLAAIGLLADAGPSPVVAAGVLLGYAALMVVPALVLVAARAFAERRMAGVLAKVQALVDRYTAQALGTVTGVGGFFLAAGAVNGLGLVG